MTLLEVLLTLTMLVLLASITWPALEGPMANQRLRKAADAVNVEWSRARVEAMSSGQMQVFRFAPDSDRYVIESRAGPEFVSDETGTTGLESGTSENAALLKSIERTLPEGITFAGGQMEYEARAEVLDVDSQGLSSTGLSWSAPILFYPDGTSSTATVQLRNEHNRTIELSLRGLTGLVTTGSVCGGEEYVP
jgi:Tfp pilus assembly protein FimT